ncbi:MAG: hypothetical protein J3K34DRAFT_412714 [Monoraphidium minutum]|nr:MAG: hypothetical protein J3K34DRAFT_412714 [Monoraphidium minutum]
MRPRRRGRLRPAWRACARCRGTNWRGRRGAAAARRRPQRCAAAAAPRRPVARAACCDAPAWRWRFGLIVALGLSNCRGRANPGRNQGLTPQNTPVSLKALPSSARRRSSRKTGCLGMLKRCALKLPGQAPSPEPPTPLCSRKMRGAAPPAWCILVAVLAIWGSVTHAALGDAVAAEAAPGGPSLPPGRAGRVAQARARGPNVWRRPQPAAPNPCAHAGSQGAAEPLTRRLQKGPRRYVIFTDCDEDDTMAITALANQQALYAGATIEAIVVEDGFLTIDQGLLWMSYWMQTFFPQLSIPIVRGYPRGEYLRETRVFPAAWVSEYTDLLDTYYPAWSTFAAPVPQSPDELAAALLSPAKGKGSFSVLSIGPTTTLPILFERYPDLLKRAEYAAFDLGSITPHLIYPGVPSSSTKVDSTWNAFMNPDGLAKAVRYLGQRKRRPKQSLVLTTEGCTAPSLVDASSVAAMQAVGAAYLASGPPPGAAAYYNVTMGFMTNIVFELGLREGSPVALWDAVTALVLLGVPIDQELRTDLPLTVSWTGNTVFDGAPEVARRCRDVAQAYDKMDPTLFFQQFIGLIFEPLAALL